MIATEGTASELNARAWTLALSSPEAALSLAHSAFSEAEKTADVAGMAEAKLNGGW